MGHNGFPDSSTDYVRHYNAQKEKPAPTTGMEFLKKLAERYRLLKAGFLASAQGIAVKTFLEQTILKQQNIKIDQAICFGLGSFLQSNSDRHYPRGDVSMSQFIAFEHWLNILQQDKKEKITVMFQDPMFGNVDRKFLEWRGFKPENIYYKAENLKVHERMTENTFLFIPCGNYKPLIHQCLEVAHSALMIGHSIELPKHMSSHRTDEQGQLVHFLAWVTKLTPSDHQFEHQLAERKITRPFYSSHVRQSLWANSDLEDMLWVPERPVINEEALTVWDHRHFIPLRFRPPYLARTREMAVYWRPDEKEILEAVGVEDEMDCECSMRQFLR